MGMIRGKRTNNDLDTLMKVYVEMRSGKFDFDGMDTEAGNERG